MLKPEFFTDAKLLALPPLVRLLFAGMWGLADRVGVLLDDPDDLHLRILPRDQLDADWALNELADRGRIVRYEVGGVRYISIRNFGKHQRPHNSERASGLPLPTVEFVRIIRGSLLGLPLHGDLRGETRISAGVGDGVGVGVGEKLAGIPSEPPPPKPPRALKEKKPTDPRHAPMVKALVEACPGYAFGGRDAKAVTDLLALGQPAEILTRWRRARERSGFPLVRALSELVTHWNHFATDAPAPKPVDLARGMVRAQDNREAHVAPGVIDGF